MQWKNSIKHATEQLYNINGVPHYLLYAETGVYSWCLLLLLLLLLAITVPFYFTFFTIASWNKFFSRTLLLVAFYILSIEANGYCQLYIPFAFIRFQSYNYMNANFFVIQQQSLLTRLRVDPNAFVLILESYISMKVRIDGFEHDVDGKFSSKSIADIAMKVTSEKSSTCMRISSESQNQMS